MKFTLNWLKEHLETNASLEEISEKLTAIGLEVEEVADKSADLAPFKVAQIIEAEPHPDADKLRVCKVNTGKEKLQIVCGAPNARAGINVVLAPVGSVIPTNGMKIKASKIRGVESHGMLCSAAELGLGEDHSGIIEMPLCNDNIAKPYASIVGLDDPVIEIAITPNRGDCLGVYGIARDLAAAGLGKLKPLSVSRIKGEFKSPVNVNITDEKECPMFVGRYFKGVKNVQSPDWLKNKLIAIELKPVSALVDITNYIAFGFCRPLHVYDATKLDGDLNVRSVEKEHEEIHRLDGIIQHLPKGITVISDNKSIQSIAGIIGSTTSGCDEDTTDVFLEVALFNPISVARTGRHLGIITDSRYRFERSVDPAFLLDAVEIASKMIMDLCGGQASELVLSGAEPKWQREIDFDFAYVKKCGGIDISVGESKKILESLGFKVTGSKISIPSWRSDIEGAADIVEEVVRIYGYDKIPTLPLPASDLSLASALSPLQKRVINIRRALVARGVTEAITWSFMKRDTAKLFGGGDKSLVLQNPISSDLDCMRPSILPNLIEALGRNQARGYAYISLFEIGLIFENSSTEGQKRLVSGMRGGKTSQKDYHKTSRDVDVFDAKADCLAALAAAGAPTANLRVTTDAPGYYHPGRSGVLRLGKTPLACFGEVHPKILKELDVKAPVVAFEVFIENIPAAKKKKTKSRSKLEISEYQSSTRDFAFLIDENVAADDILRSVRSCEKKLIEGVSLFDIYQGKGVESGKKSVAISVRIQADDHTLTEGELESLSKKIIEAVSKIGGELRG